MINIIERLKKGLKDDKFDINFLKNEIINIEKKELIVEILNTSTFSFSDIGYLFLVEPELWKDFNLEDWMYIIRKVNRPSEYKLYIDYGPSFEDIRFLYNWIGIDSIDLYKNDTQISENNKKNLNQIFPHSFLTDSIRDGDNFNEDFQDGTFGNIEYFREMRNRLLSQGAKESPRETL